MFRKIFDNLPKSTVNPPLFKEDEIVPILKTIAERLRQANWIALMTMSGAHIQEILGLGDLDQDRVAAMSAAAMSLGDRIIEELENGRLTYTIIAGKKGILLFKPLNHQFLLTLNLWPDTAIDDILRHLEESLPPLLSLIGVEQESEEAEEE